MRTNKINNIDLFTQAANEGYEKHIKTQSKRALEIINQKINWKELITPIEQKLEQSKNKNSEAGTLNRPYQDIVIYFYFHFHLL